MSARLALPAGFGPPRLVVDAAHPARRLAALALGPGMAAAGALAVGVLVACGPGEVTASEEAVAAQAPSGAPAPGPASFAEARDAAFALASGGAPPEEVRRALLAAHALDPAAYGVNVRLGQVCAELGLHAEAAAAFEQALAARPDDPASRLALVQARLAAYGTSGPAPGSGREPGAAGSDTGSAGGAAGSDTGVTPNGAADPLAALTALVESLPAELPAASRAEAHAELGRVRLRAGQFEAARAQFAAALGLAPADTGALKGLADASYRLGDPAAGEHWQEVLELVLALRDNLFTSTRLDGPEAAAEQAEAAERSEYVRREQQAQRARLLRLTQIHPAFGEAALQLAELQAAAGETAAACATVRAWDALHGAGATAAERQRLLERYCR